ncbi:MAG TPA: response regulator [Lachnospiraceae bacterium]|nr:response regulator [Lachnospiraceae bacterium]HEX3076055.1 response regulator [Lachnospiraceae bacterium]
MQLLDSLFKVLIVDNEPFIRKGLSAIIDWEAEGFCIVGEAENGREALELLREETYDLIISDIKMPEMDGIEFVTYVKENRISDAKILFLSGYYDFQYAKTAIQYGCCDYILKPIQKEELLKALRNIFKGYQMESSYRNDKRLYEKAYLDRNLMALILGKYDSLNVNYVKEKLQVSEEVAYIHFEIFQGNDTFAALSEDRKRELQRKMYQIAGHILGTYSDYVIIDVMKHENICDIGILYCAFMSQEKNMTKEEWVSWLLKELTERVNYEIVVCVGCSVQGIETIAESYKQATAIRFLRFFNSPLNEEKREVQGMGRNEAYYRKEIDELIHSIEICDKDLIRANARMLYGHIMDSQSDSKLIGLNIQYLLYCLLGLAYGQDSGFNQEEALQYIRDAVFLSGTVQGNEMEFVRFVEEYADYLMQVRQNTIKGTIGLIESEIEKNYADNLSLRSLGEKYYINSAYLGQVFKKKYGCSFKDYLNGVRMRKAAEMLLRTDEKMYEIAMKVGYKNLEYFINKFESFYGATPTRFRKRNMSS